MSREFLRQLIAQGTAEQIKAARERLHAVGSKNTAKYNEDVREVWGMTLTKGWTYIADWLADRANPYNAYQNGQFDLDKLKDTKLAMELLNMVSAMVEIAKENQAREGKDV